MRPVHITKTGVLVFSICALLAPVLAKSQVTQGNIFTCVDAAGRRWTSDRPIAQCVDREQRVLGPSGVERKRIAPALTEVEMAQRLEARRLQELKMQRIVEQRRRDGALLARYPSRGSHEAERQQNLAQLGESQLSAEKRLAELQAMHAEQAKELAFYANDPSRISASLRLSIEAAQSSEQEQQRLIDRQTAEKQRVNQRFDAELERLEMLWNAQKPIAPVSLSTASSKD